MRGLVSRSPGPGVIAALTAFVLMTSGGCAAPSPPPAEPAAGPTADEQPAAAAPAAPAAGPPGAVEFPRESWQAAGLVIVPAAVGQLAETAGLTGRITLNEDRLAHVYPLVEGRVAEVLVGLGDKVTKGQRMAGPAAKDRRRGPPG